MEEVENVLEHGDSRDIIVFVGIRLARSRRTARAMARTVAGLVLQHPPMSAAPARLHSPTLDTKSVPVAPSESCKLTREVRDQWTDHQPKSNFFFLLCHC